MVVQEATIKGSGTLRSNKITQRIWLLKKTGLKTSGPLEFSSTGSRKMEKKDTLAESK
jgi:hypothetical protein